MTFRILYIGQQARTFLEKLPREANEEKLVTIIRVNGKTAINQLRDQARKIGPQLSMKRRLNS